MVGTLHPHFKMLFFHAGFATLSARLRLLAVVLSMFFPKVGIESGFKIETTFLFLSNANNRNRPRISQGNKIYKDTFRNIYIKS
jgi:hypothetical protein